MRPKAVLSEAARNVSTGTTGALVLTLLLGTVCAALSLVDASSIENLREKAKAFVSTRASVRVLNAQGRVDPGACERLPQSGTIRTAGALHQAAPLTLSAAPANSIPTFTVTPGLGAVLGVRAVSDSGVWMSQDLARTLGATPGQRLSTTRGGTVLAGTFAWPNDGRDNRLAYAVLQPVSISDTAMDECWADVWPSTDAADDLLRSATFVRPNSTEPMTIGQVNNVLGAVLDPEREFRSRPTRYALPGCLAGGLLLGFVAVRRRRLEYSGALHSGQGRRAQVTTALLETAVWALGGAVVSASALSLALTWPGGTLPHDTFALDVRGPLIGALGGGLGALAALALIREDHLFRYFKER
jgi:hypothetical protein